MPGCLYADAYAFKSLKLIRSATRNLLIYALKRLRVVSLPENKRKKKCLLVCCLKTLLTHTHTRILLQWSYALAFYIKNVR